MHVEYAQTKHKVLHGKSSLNKNVMIINTETSVFTQHAAAAAVEAAAGEVKSYHFRLLL